jgi:hypothetical protein
MSENDPPASKIVASWNPLQCGDPHRVAVDLEDTEGAPISSSTICETGELVLDAEHYGDYRGRVYAWQLGVGERSSQDVHLVVDDVIVQWAVDTPR